MGLDRSFIERDDFASARKGHDPAEVAEHLAAVADAVEGLERARAGPAPASSKAADSVRSIVEAAETSAAEIEAGARRDAERMRSSAEAEAAEHVERVRNAAAALLERADAIERELGALVAELAEGLRAGAAALAAEVARLRPRPESPATVRVAARPAGESLDPEGPAPGRAETPPPADTGPDVPPPDVEEEPQPESVPGPQPEEALEPDAAADAMDPLPAEPVEPGRTGAHVASNGGRTPAESRSEGARLIALNMALNGTPREETASYLRENFELEEPERLLDDVYARAGR